MLDEQHFFKRIKHIKGRYTGPLLGFGVIQQAIVNEGLHDLIINEWTNHCLEKVRILRLDIGVQLMADLIVIDFEFFLLRVSVPVENPILHCDALDVGEA